MDYIIGIIVAVLLMSIAWTSPDQSIGSKSFYSDILTGVLYFIAFSIGSTIAGALFKALLIVYAYGSTWVGAMIAERSVADANAAAMLAWEQIDWLDFTFRIGANVLWGWTFCFLAFSFRIVSGHWPHQWGRSRTD
jgi:hypothetical protein